MRYQRADVKGGIYFFTVNLAQRHLRLLLDNVNKRVIRINQLIQRLGINN
ncbi:MAG: hypothetical protein Q7T35_00760 [Nitrosomonas sp.]|nr:hypothetical protein [Nitrosomonas sp.]